MTGTELAVRPEAQQMTVLSNEQLTYIAGTEFVPPGLRGNLPAILACVATGRALGIADMTALRSIHVIDGKATFSAELMVQLVRRQGHSITGEVTEGKAVVKGTRADNGDTMTATWTLAMAERAGLLGKQNWKKYPEAMLWARAASQLCRMLFADCFAGATYTTEELGDEDTGIHGAPVSDAAADTPFSYDPDPPVDAPLMTAAQKKKANVLVGKLRDQEGRITTRYLYEQVGRDVPVEVADEELHWSPLRDSLTKVEASVLIDHLEGLEPASEPPSEAGSEDAATLTAELLAVAGDDEEKRAAVQRAIDANRVKHVAHPEAHLAWLVGQVAKRKASVAA